VKIKGEERGEVEVKWWVVCQAMLGSDSFNIEISFKALKLMPYL